MSINHAIDFAAQLATDPKLILELRCLYPNWPRCIIPSPQIPYAHMPSPFEPDRTVLFGPNDPEQERNLVIVFRATMTWILRLRWAAYKLEHPSERLLAPSKIKKASRSATRRISRDTDSHLRCFGFTSQPASSTFKSCC